jgi:hypothetical protein
VLWSYAGSNTPMDPVDMPPVAIALVRDLMFSGKISATARAMKLPIKIVRDAAQLGSQPAKCLLVDLHLDGALAAAVQWQKATANPVLAFAKHTDAEMIVEARKAGINQVVARSGFEASLPTFLQEAASPS